MDRSKLNEMIQFEDEDAPILSMFFFLFGAFTILVGIVIFLDVAGYVGFHIASTDALFLMLFGIMIAYTGFTPVGSLHRSWLIYFIGLAISLIGMFSAMSPGTITTYTDEMLGIILIVMGVCRLGAYLLRLEKTKNKNVPIYYTISLIVLYAACVVSGILMFVNGDPPDFIASVMIVMGIALIIIACTVKSVEKLVPEIIPWMNDHHEESKYWILNSVDLSTKNMFTLQGGFTVLVMCFLAFFGAIKVIPYDMDASVSIFVFNLALQIMISGDTPIGEFKINWILVILGMVIAVMAIFSCAVGGLSEYFTMALGVENIVMGAVGLVHMYGLYKKIKLKIPGKMPKILVKILAVGCILYIAVFPFGTNMLFPGTISSIAMLFVMAVTGIMLITLTLLLRKAKNSGVIKTES